MSIGQADGNVKSPSPLEIVGGQYVSM